MLDWTESYDEKTLETQYTATAPSCDFPSVFEILTSFHDENSLEDCCLAIRDYEPDEIRENGSASIIEAFEEKRTAAIAAGKKEPKAPKTKDVDPDSGRSWVTSFHWNTHKAGNAKQISYLFYDSGWPCKIVFSKIPCDDKGNTTRIEAVFSNHSVDLASRFKEIAEQMFD